MLTAVLWDMDGTLIDSEPYWHDVECEIARAHGGVWTEEMGWLCSGKPVPRVAERMVENGTQLSVDEIGELMIQGVAEREIAHMPWVPDVENVLRSLAKVGVPSVLVTASPRKLAERLMEQAPKGAFIGCVCGDDGLARKPDPAPYLAAAKLLGVDREQRSADDFALAMAHCVAIEDSFTGLQSAAGSGATTLAQTAFMPTDTSQGPQFASIDGYADLTVSRLEDYAARRISRDFPRA
ncbi:Beta-phosphoglucomutase, HAD superfamily [Bifidobacterium bohemicum]|uniref:HAD hydrolase, family IA, variant 3 n=1 Tax=Bifidobacterium bohemicum DSM 22767 TaxID=1437606 RepID=A0A086ZHC4_9BIFI|nr:HAD family phosphatase [Bifidobacterium bohemicum]KFI45924.1 HAD hydrolase, family IA, variant 3 [Bifidobacterium bohemicum DSM 22767]SCC14944.1 Beta-phosphoglucomutase, HAD superfamily [Bifidobacterium bohemicum]